MKRIALIFGMALMASAAHAQVGGNPLNGGGGGGVTPATVNGVRCSTGSATTDTACTANQMGTALNGSTTLTSAPNLAADASKLTGQIPVTGLPTMLWMARQAFFGDSITQGQGCSYYAPGSSPTGPYTSPSGPHGGCFAGILTAAHGGAPVNYGRGGTLAEQKTPEILSYWPLNTTLTNNYGDAVPPIATLSVGINNGTSCITTACQQNYTAAMQANIALLEQTPGYTYPTSGCTFTGTWASGSALQGGTVPQTIRTSTTNGDSFSCPNIVTNGNPIGLYFASENAGGGVVSCTVDGGSATSINLFPTGTVSPTETVIRPELPAASGTHTVACTVTSATNAANQVRMILADSLEKNPAAGRRSQLTVTNVTSSGGTNDAATQTISNLVLPVVTAMQAETGTNAGYASASSIRFADIRTPTNSTTMYTATTNNPGYQCGGLHPCDSGHYAIAKAIMAASPDLYLEGAGDRVDAMQWGGSVGGSYYTNQAAAYDAAKLNGQVCVYGTSGCMSYGTAGATNLPRQIAGQPRWSLAGLTAQPSLRFDNNTFCFSLNGGFATGKCTFAMYGNTASFSVDLLVGDPAQVATSSANPGNQQLPALRFSAPFWNGTASIPQSLDLTPVYAATGSNPAIWLTASAQGWSSSAALAPTTGGVGLDLSGWSNGLRATQYLTSVGTAIAAQATVTVSGTVHVTSSTAPITNITPPTGCTTTGFECTIKFIPDVAFTTAKGGNIALSSTAVQFRTLFMTYDPAQALWYPSY